MFLFAVCFDAPTIGANLTPCKEKVICRYAPASFFEIPPFVCLLCHYPYLWDYGNILSPTPDSPIPPLGIMNIDVTEPQTPEPARLNRPASFLSLVPDQPQPTAKPPKKQRKKRVTQFDGFRQYNKGPKVERVCLSCGEPFNSVGIGNRLCQHCRKEVCEW